MWGGLWTRCECCIGDDGDDDDGVDVQKGSGRWSSDGAYRDQKRSGPAGLPHPSHDCDTGMMTRCRCCQGRETGGRRTDKPTRSIDPASHPTPAQIHSCSLCCSLMQGRCWPPQPTAHQTLSLTTSQLPLIYSHTWVTGNGRPLCTSYRPNNRFSCAPLFTCTYKIRMGSAVYRQGWKEVPAV